LARRFDIVEDHLIPGEFAPAASLDDIREST